VVKATDFKFDMHVSRDSPDMTPLKFFEKGASIEILSYERLLAITVIIIHIWVAIGLDTKKIVQMHL